MMNSQNIYMDILKRKLTHPQTSQINKKIKQRREQGVIVWYVKQHYPRIIYQLLFNYLSQKKR